MDEKRFEEILEKLEKRKGDGRTFTSEDLVVMTNNQLSKLTLKMMDSVGPGSYNLTAELYDLIEYLDSKVSIGEDPFLEKSSFCCFFSLSYAV